MTDCVDVKEARIRGVPLEGALAEHAASCPWCSSAAEGAPPAFLEPDLFSSIEGTIAAERGPRAWLRSRSTRARLVITAGIVMVVALAVVQFAPRSRYAPVPLARVVLAVSVLSVLLLALARLSLRPLQVPAPSRRVLWLSALAGLFIPVAFAVLPSAAPFMIPHVSALLAGFVCFGGGVLAGAVVVLALRLLDRQNHASYSTALLAAAAGGLAGNLALELHCPVTHASHLLTSHASVGFVLVAVYALFRRAS